MSTSRTTGRDAEMTSQVLEARLTPSATKIYTVTQVAFLLTHEARHLLLRQRKAP